MFCSTPVENLFLEEYMPNAPAQFVKVYLYGLMQCYYPDTAGDLARIAHTLHMSEDEVREAFFYWQQQGLVRIVYQNETPAIIYTILPRDARGFSSLPEPNRFFEFNRDVQQLFDPRQLTPRELDGMHNWLESYGFPEKSALMLCEYCIRMHGRDVAIAYMNTVAENWAREGLLSAEDISAHLESRSAQVRETLNVLAALGIRKRSASEPELALYRKWTGQWGFSYDAVMLACMQSASAQQPTMKYVDSILSSFMQNGIYTPDQIEAHVQQREQKKSAAIAIQKAMGVNGPASATLMQCLDEWRSKYGYDVPVVLLAARQAARRNQKTLDALENYLVTWHNAGLLSAEDIQSHLAGQSRTNDEVLAVYQRLQMDYAPNEQSRSAIMLWTSQWHLSMDVILFGADLIAQSGTQYDRMRALHKLLHSWYEAGVRTVADAQSFQRSNAQQQAPAYPRQGQEKPEALRYSQRTNSLDDLYMDL